MMLSREINDIFNKAYARDPLGATLAAMTTVSSTSPNYMNTGRGADSIVMWKELPGVKAKDIEIEVDAQSHTLALKVESTNPYFKTQIETRQTISKDADLEADVETTLEDGILTLTFPLKASAKPRKLEVKAIN